MDRRYYGFKIALVALGLLIAAATGMSTQIDDSRPSMAHLHYGAATEVEVAVLRTSAKASHAIVHFLHKLRSF
jgi:hypothetical protein